MSKDSFNPFASLDVKSFPERRKGAPAPHVRGHKTVVKNPNARKSPDDEDSEMFLQYLGMTEAAGSKGSSGGRNAPAKAAKGRASAEKPTYADAGPALSEAGMREALGGLGKSFRSMRPEPAVKADASAQDDECRHGTDEHRTLVQMARNARRIAKADDGNAPARELGSPEADADDSRDFLSAVKGTKRLGGAGRDVPAEPEVQSVPYTDPRHPLQDFMEGKVEFSVASTDEYAEGHVVGLDLMVVSQLQSGQLSPEAHMDLHGLNSSQAYSNLVGFFRSAWYKGVRVVLIVTGRGLNSFNGMPILRGKVQEWLTHDPFKRIVLAFCSARQEDGGAGAFYVLLRKYRKGAGKIRWDTMPEDPDLYL
ncbi:MAG: Smr/MutS family protein [Mailhella sp.]|nr:Smr/MutS family protein [Mailhella sp.]